MIRPLTAYYKELLSDRDALASSIDCPVLLWEAGLCAPDDSPGDVRTSEGGATFNPSPANPLVLQVRPESTRSEVAGISVGRSDTNDVVVHNASISRLHALIYRDPRSNDWRITDAGSRNGTSVDGAPVAREQQAVLSDGATVQIGDVRLRFLLPDSFLNLLVSRASK